LIECRGVRLLNVPSELQLAMLAAVRFAYPSKLGAKGAGNRQISVTLI